VSAQVPAQPPCEGCEPQPIPIAPGTPVRRVTADGRPLPQAAPAARKLAEQARAAVSFGPDGAPSIDPQAEVFKGVHPLVIDLIGQVENLSLLVEALIESLGEQGRGLLTDREFQRSLEAVQRRRKAQFEAQVAQLGRQFAQRPTSYGPASHAPPTQDPRRAPTK
jgi:hypothetical protein